MDALKNDHEDPEHTVSNCLWIDNAQPVNPTCSISNGCDGAQWTMGGVYRVRVS